MPTFLSQSDAFLRCKKEAKIIIIEDIDLEKIKAILRIADGDIGAGKRLREALEKESNQWNSVYKLYYDALHELVGAFLHFEKIKSDNHQCLFAYLCEKHPELELNWDFFEKVRTKRNGINYYGISINQSDWKDVELQFTLYLNKLKEEIKKRIQNFEKIPF